MLDLSAYAGRWVALAGEQVAGVGYTAVEAEALAQRNRPKERFVLRYVEPPGGTPLVLPLLLEQLRPLLQAHRHPVYLVGGMLRDALLNRPSHDLDFVVAAQAIQLAFRVGDQTGWPVYILDRERDTGRVVLPDGKTTLDFACFRGETLEDDLRARDFTINAIAMPAAAYTTTSLVDPTDGIRHLVHQEIHLTQPTAVAQDPIRALRAVRLAFVLDFALSPAVQASLRTADLTAVSQERIRDEWFKLLQTAVPHQAMAMLADDGLLAQIAPELNALATVQQSPPHHENVWAHTLSVLHALTQLETAVTMPVNETVQGVQEALLPYLDQLTAHWQRPYDGGINGQLLLRVAALFHDVGKAQTQTVDKDGRIRFLNHDVIGANSAAQRLQTLCLSNEAVSHVANIVRHHMRPLLLAHSNAATKLSRRAIYRYFRDTGVAGLDVAWLSLADHLATYQDVDDEAWQRLVRVVRQLFESYFTQYEEIIAPEPLVNGRDLMQELHLPPGPEVGRLLRLIREAQAVGEIDTAVAAIEFARKSCA